MLCHLRKKRVAGGKSIAVFLAMVNWDQLAFHVKLDFRLRVRNRYVDCVKDTTFVIPATSTHPAQMVRL